MRFKIFIYLCFSFQPIVFAVDFSYPQQFGDTLIEDYIKSEHYTLAKQEDTLLDIARRFDIGQNEILLANPTVDRWLPKKNTKVVIPSRRLLPNTPHEGIVLNLAEYRLYYYPRPQLNQVRQVITNPISIGRVDWDTPLGTTRIIAKNKNPVWRPPESIKREHAEQGEILPDIFPAGPDNPLGLFALRLGISGYLIHSTNKPFGVGMRVSHGCIRMYPEDIEALFPQIKIGVPVHIVNQPIKVGWSNNVLYIEVSPYLDEQDISYAEKLAQALDLIEQANHFQLPRIDGKILKQALQKSNGIPVAIYKKSRTLFSD